MHARREYQPVPTFDYSSPFSYRSVYDSEFASADDDLYGKRVSLSRTSSEHDTSLLDTLLYNLLVSLAYLFVLLTFPISSWLCVKKIDSLQRCLTHRLGKRLPLKGPGFILKLPFIDELSIVDLFEQDFVILEQDEQILTADGSIVQARKCHASLQVTDAVLTKTSLNQSVDVKNCLKLRLNNLIRSKHVEDLERKIDYIVHAYEDDANRFLKKWGYAIKLQQRPTFVVLERADPMSSIKKQIEQVLNPDASSGPSDNPLENFLRNSASTFLPKNASDKSNPVVEESSTLTPEEINSGATILREILQQYKQYLMFYSELTIKFCVSTSIVQYYSYVKENNSLLKLEFEPLKIDLSIEFSSCDDYRRFLQTRDMSLIKYKLIST